jgi:hypothetical protein
MGARGGTGATQGAGTAGAAIGSTAEAVATGAGLALALRVGERSGGGSFAMKGMIRRGPRGGDVVWLIWNLLGQLAIFTRFQSAFP